MLIDITLINCNGSTTKTVEAELTGRTIFGEWQDQIKPLEKIQGYNGPMFNGDIIDGVKVFNRYESPKAYEVFST